MSDLISRQAAIDAMTNTLWHYPNECYRNLNEYEFAKGLSELGLKSVPSAQPYSEADIQKMQDLEQAEIQKAYELGREEGRKEAQPEQQWVLVKEKLPEEDKDVLVTVHFLGLEQKHKSGWNDHIKPSYYVDIASHIDGEWSSASDEYKVARNRHIVIAWKELPDPYREEGENG